MRIPGFNGQLAVNVALTVSGSGALHVGAITLDASQGSVAIDGDAYSAVVVARQASDSIKLYEVIAVPRTTFT
jgi:hypothetical protein